MVCLKELLYNNLDKRVLDFTLFIIVLFYYYYYYYYYYQFFQRRVTQKAKSLYLRNGWRKGTA